jgi:hypothetical protein
MEVIAHTATATYSSGKYAILKLDATNGFQEIKRSSLHEAVWRRCPQLYPLFRKFYTKEAVCFFDAEGSVKLIKSQEGARIGCKLGSFAFATTIHDVLAKLQSKIQKEGSIVKAATDDIVIILKADRPELLYDRANRVIKILNEGGNKIGLTFTNDKASLLLPLGWKTPPTGTFPSHLHVLSNVLSDVTCQGLEIVGSPVGSKAYCVNFVE